MDAAALLLAASAFALGAAVSGRGPHRPVADPRFLEEYARTYRFTLGTPQAIRMAPEGEAILFLRSGPRSFVRDLFEWDPGGAGERRLAAAEALLGGREEQIPAEESARRERERLAARGIASFDLSRDGRRVLIPLSGRLFVLERASGRVLELPGGGGFPIDPRLSPDGSKVACVREGDLYVLEVETGRQTRVTDGATATLSHGLAEFVAQEEMGRREGYWWSPDSKAIAYEESDTSRLDLLHIADPLHPELPAQSWPYPRPGRENARVRLGVVSVRGGETVWVNWDHDRYPYLASATWKEKAPLTLLVQSRDQKREVLLAADPATGRTHALLEEADAAWLDLHPSVPRWLDDGSAFLWISERSGEPRLEMRGAGGRLERVLTPEGFGLRQVAGVDREEGTAFVTASADPTQSQIWRVPLDGSPPKLLSEGPGLDEALVGRDGRASVWIERRLSGERRWSVHGRDGKKVGELTSVAEEPPFLPSLEMATVGPRGFRSAVIRPRAFERGRKYPVLVYVYGGPTSQTVVADPRGYLLQQWLADHGFVVVTLDGRGTPNRGRAWERAVRGDLIDVALHDQVEGLEALGERFPELDLSRVGIYGWSFGGYVSAMAAMRRPDVYRAAVAGAPVCDWRDYDTHYTERYLGTPEDDPEGYRKSSVLNYCADLKVPLLIVHGTADDNVYFLHGLKMADALFRAGIPFEFLPLSGTTHMVPDPAVTRGLWTRIADFFVERLRP
jgi:dipeptidyl-peptidase-4